MWVHIIRKTFIVSFRNHLAISIFLWCILFPRNVTKFRQGGAYFRSPTLLNLELFILYACTSLFQKLLLSSRQFRYSYSSRLPFTVFEGRGCRLAPDRWKAFFWALPRVSCLLGTINFGLYFPKQRSYWFQWCRTCRLPLNNWNLDLFRDKHSMAACFELRKCYFAVDS